MSLEGEVVFGLRAGLAVLAKRPDDVLKLAHGREARAEVEAALLGAGRGAKVQRSERSDEELGRLAGSPQHEGLVLLARARAWLKADALARALARGRGAAVALDRVRNPYNVGAILRSAAFFGFDAALLGAPAPHPGLAPQAVRVAEGGVEHLAMARTTDLADTLGRLRAAGVRVVGADAGAAGAAFGFAFGRPVVLVMGNEREGLLERVRAQCDAVVAIPGTRAVESLNVAVAAGVLLAEIARSS